MMAKSKDYQKRFYRDWIKTNGLMLQEVIVGETDILVSAEGDLKETAKGLVRKYRDEIERYIKARPYFKASLEPVEPDEAAPLIVKEMIRSSRSAGVGPMASVAGAIAEFVGKALLSFSHQIIVENGGDIFLKSDIERNVAVFAGSSPLTSRLFIKIRPQDRHVGICTSSGTVGHSLSFGKADACVIISTSTPLADAVATASCNRVKKKEDIRSGLDFALSIKGIQGALIVCGKDFGVLGDIELSGG